MRLLGRGHGAVIANKQERRVAQYLDLIQFMYAELSVDDLFILSTNPHVLQSPSRRLLATNSDPECETRISTTRAFKLASKPWCQRTVDQPELN